MATKAFFAGMMMTVELSVATMMKALPHFLVVVGMVMDLCINTISTAACLYVAAVSAVTAPIVSWAYRMGRRAAGLASNYVPTSFGLTSYTPLPTHHPIPVLELAKAEKAPVHSLPPAPRTPRTKKPTPTVNPKQATPSVKLMTPIVTPKQKTPSVKQTTPTVALEPKTPNMDQLTPTGPPSDSDLLKRASKHFNDEGALISQADLNLAKNLLDAPIPTPSFKPFARKLKAPDGGRLSRLRDRWSSYNNQLSTSDPVDDGPPSPVVAGTDWQLITNHAVWNPTDAHIFASVAASDFNELAESVDLPTIEQYQQEGITPPTSLHGPRVIPAPPEPPRNWLARKFLRKTASTKSLAPSSSTQPMPKKKSAADLGVPAGVPVPRTLDDIVRLGGLSAFHLPDEFRPCNLSIPTGLAATANYVANHRTYHSFPSPRNISSRHQKADSQAGKNVTGIFRIPGSFGTVSTMVKHYTQQIESAEKGPEEIESNVGLATLPAGVYYDVHDVASAFKKLLATVPGGILGSRWLFDLLRDISDHPIMGRSDQTGNVQWKRDRLCALAIASSGSVHRAHLICAVFGLLSVIGSEAEAARIAREERRESESSERMGFEALSVVFGPLLIGDLMNEITLPSAAEARTSSSSSSSTSTKARNGVASAANQARARIAEVQANLAKQLEQTTIAVRITKMLITNWKQVARCFRNAGILGYEVARDKVPTAFRIEEAPKPKVTTPTKTTTTTAIPATAINTTAGTTTNTTINAATNTTTESAVQPAPQKLGRSRSVSDILQRIERATTKGLPRRIVFSYSGAAVDGAAPSSSSASGDGVQPEKEKEGEKSQKEVDDTEVMKASSSRLSSKKSFKMLFGRERQTSSPSPTAPLHEEEKEEKEEEEKAGSVRTKKVRSHKSLGTLRSAASIIIPPRRSSYVHGTEARRS
ncbi:MAG: hypothetical protein M1823_005613 [Watsoniomyces obsoletus]|nr:MAG: hypothetical protein M1823_005613 [Watsoniomyces obsoletus]